MARLAERSEGRPGEQQLPLGRTLGFMQLVWTLSHALHSMSRKTENVLGITGPQRLVLRVVGGQSGISAGALAEVLRLHPSTITGLVRRLEERGLLVREHDAEDARVVRLTLTPAGARLNGRHASTVEAAARRALKRMDPRTMAAAEEALAVLVEELSAE
jgi:MarR family transcriptional regulator, organic hydroperoxide resistance regulator